MKLRPTSYVRWDAGACAENEDGLCMDQAAASPHVLKNDDCAHSQRGVQRVSARTCREKPSLETIIEDVSVQSVQRTVVVCEQQFSTAPETDIARENAAADGLCSCVRSRGPRSERMEW